MVTQVEKFPWGPMDMQSPADAAAISVTVQSTKTKINMPNLQAYTLSLSPEQNLLPGSEVEIEIVQSATPRNIAFGGTNVKSAALTGTASKTERVCLTWDGTQFAAKSAWVSI